MIDVRAVSSQAELDAFLHLPEKLPGAVPGWAPVLSSELARTLSDRNPLWRGGRGERQLLLAYAADRPVGRIVAHVDHYANARWNERAGLFGFLSCCDDVATAAALLTAATDYHRVRGLTVLRGPYELGVSQRIGALVAGFEEPPAFSQAWNEPYIPRLLAACGFHVVARAATYRADDLSRLDPDALLGSKHRAWLADPRMRVRTWKPKSFDRDLRATMLLLTAAFRDTRGFVPLSEAEVTFLAAALKRVIRLEFTCLVELAGEPVAASLCLPDYNVPLRESGGRPASPSIGPQNGEIDGALCMFIGTSPSLQDQGVIRVAISQMLRALQRAGFRTADSTWAADDNAKSIANAQALGMRVKHRLAVYERGI